MRMFFKIAISISLMVIGAGITADEFSDGNYWGVGYSIIYTALAVVATLPKPHNDIRSIKRKKP